MKQKLKNHGHNAEAVNAMKRNKALQGMMKLWCSELTVQSHDVIASCTTSPVDSLFADVMCPPDSISFFCSVSTWDPPAHR